jgi:hypothetical protein
MTPDRLPTVAEHRIAKLFASVLGGAGILLLVAFEWRGLNLISKKWYGERISPLDTWNVGFALAIPITALIVGLIIMAIIVCEWLCWALANDPAKPAERFDEEDKS